MATHCTDELYEGRAVEQPAHLVQQLTHASPTIIATLAAAVLGLGLPVAHVAAQLWWPNEPPPS